MIIRHEEPRDHDAIHQLTLRAFEEMPYSNGSEAPIIRGLRNAGDLTISLVAEDNGEIIGHIAFSPVTIGGKHDGWFGLEPVSVSPDRQKQGIGRALIEEGLKRLQKLGASGCALVGSPDLYSRWGFESDGQLAYGSLDRRYVQRFIFRGKAPSGELAFAAVFDLAGTGSSNAKPTNTGTM